MSELIPAANISLLPSTGIPNNLLHIKSIVSNLGLSRDIIASDEEIEIAWNNLPREIKSIPEELRNELIARMCIATSVGLFDGAINYIWNATILVLREKIRKFGFGFVAQTLGKTFEEKNLIEMTDSSLIELCNKLKLLPEEGFFFLDQCREIRNNFSAAHPSMSKIDDRELINFISRCCKYGLTTDYQLQGVDIPNFLSAIKEKKWDTDQLSEWTTVLASTFEAQRELLIPMLHGMYCDSTINEETRLNCLALCTNMKKTFNEKIKSDLIEKHNTYKLKGQNDKISASKSFFEKLDSLELLSETEIHSMIKNACSRLWNAHLGWHNFYNEVPFAELLYDLVLKTKRPTTVQAEYVITVLSCYMGNAYGTSEGAIYYYRKMIQNFSPKEIEILLRYNNVPNGRQKEMYLNAIDLLDKNSILTPIVPLYEAKKRK